MELMLARVQLSKFQAKKEDASSAGSTPSLSGSPTRSVASPPPLIHRTTPLSFSSVSPGPWVPQQAPPPPLPPGRSLSPPGRRPSRGQPSPAPASPPHSNSTEIVVTPPIPSSPTTSADLVHTQQQTISLLVADKPHFATRLRDLEHQLGLADPSAHGPQSIKGDAELRAIREANARLVDEAKAWADQLKNMVRASLLNVFW